MLMEEVGVLRGQVVVVEVVQPFEIWQIQMTLLQQVVLVVHLRIVLVVTADMVAA
jgi:hypothetical protein